ncbi:hypothetical protein QBC44DRAFT_331350 [Cladorrhinum sp. PSN332]|nr:hypothetical protein QBC44DRAFT_331350 [Cladorrhinum sp. PSN332]
MGAKSKAKAAAKAALKTTVKLPRKEKRNLQATLLKLSAADSDATTTGKAAAAAETHTAKALKAAKQELLQTKQELQEHRGVLHALADNSSKDPMYEQARARLQETNKELSLLRVELRDQLRTVQAYIADSPQNAPRKYGKYQTGDLVFCAACGQGMLPKERREHNKKKCPVIRWKELFQQAASTESESAPPPSPEEEESSSSAEEPAHASPEALTTGDDTTTTAAAAEKPTSGKPPKVERTPEEERARRTCRVCAKVFDTRDEMFEVLIRDHCSRRKPCSEYKKQLLLGEASDNTTPGRSPEEATPAAVGGTSSMALLREEVEAAIREIEEGLDFEEGDDGQVELETKGIEETKETKKKKKSEAVKLDDENKLGDLDREVEDFLKDFGRTLSIGADAEDMAGGKEEDGDAVKEALKGDELRKWMSQIK